MTCSGCAKPPLLQPPVHLAGADPANLRPMVVGAAQKAAPMAGIFGAAAVGAVFAYFVPKLLDQAVSAWRDRDDHGEPVELELDDERD